MKKFMSLLKVIAANSEWLFTYLLMEAVLNKQFWL